MSTCGETLCRRNDTDPSHRRTFTPPLWNEYGLSWLVTLTMSQPVRSSWVPLLITLYPISSAVPFWSAHAPRTYGELLLRPMDGIGSGFAGVEPTTATCNPWT